MPNLTIILPESSRPIHQVLAENRTDMLERRMTDLVIEERRQNHLLVQIAILLVQKIRSNQIEMYKTDQLHCLRLLA